MPWVRVDDHFDEHPKLAKVGPLGWALWLAGLAYSNRNLTDGFIPWSVAQGLVTWQYLEAPDEEGRRKQMTIAVTSGMAGGDVETDRVIELLLWAGVWEPRDGGYYIHDYPDYQFTRAEIEAKRAAGQAGGQASAKARARVPGRALPQAKPVPDPVPDPDPKKSRCSSRDNSDEFAQAKTVYESEIGPLTPLLLESLERLLALYPSGWFEEAVGVAVKNGKRKLSYIEGILKQWQAKGKGDNRERPLSGKYRGQVRH